MVNHKGARTEKERLYRGVVEYLKSCTHLVSINDIAEELIGKGIRTSKYQVASYMPLWLKKPRSFAKGYKLKVTADEPKGYWLEKINSQKEDKPNEGLEEKL